MIALVDGRTVLKIFAAEKEAKTRYTLPNGKQISPITLGWTADTYAVLPVTPFAVPDGKRKIGLPSYTVGRDVVAESYAVEDIPVERRMVRKSVVLARLTDPQLEAILAILSARQMERWRSPDHPAVYFDDPDTVAILKAVGADPAVVLAEDEN